MPDSLGIEIDLDQMPPTTLKVTFHNAINHNYEEKTVHDPDPVKALAEARRLAREYCPFNNTRPVISYLAGQYNMRYWWGPSRERPDGYEYGSIPIRIRVPVWPEDDRG